MERAALLARVGRAGASQACLYAGAGDVEELELELFALSAAHPGRDTGFAAARFRRPEADLRAVDGRRQVDRDDEPHGAAGRVGPVARAHARRAPGGPLPHLGPE